MEIVDPNFGSSVYRVTDAATNSPAFQYEPVLVNSSGSAEQMGISCDDSLALVSNTSGAQFPIIFGGATGVFPANPRMYTTTDSSTNGFSFPSGSTPIGWSHVCPANNQLAYVLGGSDGATIQSWNFNGNCASCSTPSGTTLYDLKTSPNGLGSTFHITWTATGGTTYNDTDMTFGIGGAPAWTNSYNYQTYANGVISGMIVYPTTGNAGGYLYQASAACTGQSTGTPTWNQTPGGTNSDGTCTMTNVGTGGQEDVGTQYVLAWRNGLGVRTLNVQTGGVAGDWGPVGTISSFACSNYLHEVKIGKVGGAQGWTAIGYGAPCVASQEYGWNYAASSLAGSFYTLCSYPYCSGHTAKGMLTYFNNPGDSVPNFFDVCFTGGSTLLCPTVSANGVTSALPSGGASGFDSHWGGNSLNDAMPFCGTTVTSTVPNKAWMNEAICVPPVYAAGTNVYRFAQTENTGLNADFYITNAISVISQSGKWMMAETDWQGEWGSISGGSTCVIAGSGPTACTGGIIAIQLSPGSAPVTPTPIWPNGALLGAIPRDPLYPHLAGGTN
jgi:hypothetical protein